MSGTNGSGDGLLHFSDAPNRVVSLVPSMTDSLYELGAGAALVGVTTFCPRRLGDGKEPARVGGTHDFDVDSVVALKPDLILANQEENPKDLVLALEAAGLSVWLTFPKDVEEVIEILYTLVRLFRLPEAVPRVQTLELTLDWTRRASPARRSRVFCPIWLQQGTGVEPWYMTFNGDTYAHDVLWRCHGENIFRQRIRHYPLEADLGQVDPEPAGERDTRYPRVTLREVLELDPEIILLPSEPFPFAQDHKQLVSDHFAGTSAVTTGEVHLVDGRLLAWHGTRLASALANLPQLLQA